LPLTPTEAEQAEKTAAKILRDSGFEWSVPSRVAAALGFKVDMQDIPGFEGSTTKESKTLQVSPGYYPRVEFTVAHELAHHFVPLTMRVGAVEAFCNRVAAALLLPSARFCGSAVGNGCELPTLRHEWPWASWQVIMWRITELLPGIGASVWVNCEPVERRHAYTPAEVTRAEALSVRDAQRRGRAIVKVAGICAIAWNVVAPRGQYVAMSLALPDLLKAA
jgi:hypothetical protein